MNTDQTIDDNHNGARCEHCGDAFTVSEWDNRHDVHEDECETETWSCTCDAYVHDDCCRECNDGETQRRRRGHAFYPVGVDIPNLYATENVRLADKTIQAHYFLGACDWWVVEYNADERIAWGYACLGDPGCAEWSNVSLTELEAINVHGVWVVERDLYWEPVTVEAACLPGRPT